MAEVGTKLLFENERVKIWEFTLMPGKRSKRTSTKTPTFSIPSRAVRWNLAPVRSDARKARSGKGLLPR